MSKRKRLASGDRDQAALQIPVGTNSVRAQMTQTVMRGQLHIGPLPDPETLAAYEQLLPGAADRVIKMAEKQSEHRQAIELIAVNGDIARERRGQMFAGVLGLIVACGGIYLIATGHAVQGLSTLVASLAGPMSILIFKKKTQRKELAEKRPDLPSS